MAGEEACQVPSIWRLPVPQTDGSKALKARWRAAAKLFAQNKQCSWFCNGIDGEVRGRWEVFRWATVCEEMDLVPILADSIHRPFYRRLYRLIIGVHMNLRNQL